jgi:hypothetical protein
LIFHEGQGRDILSFICKNNLDMSDFASPLIVVSGEVLGNMATAKERPISMLCLK